MSNTLLKIGIPCWLLLNAHVGKPVEDMVGNYLRHTPELQKAIETLKDSRQEKIEEISELYTVLHKTIENRFKNYSKEFILKNEQMPSPPSIDFTKPNKVSYN